MWTAIFGIGKALVKPMMEAWTAKKERKDTLARLAAHTEGQLELSREQTRAFTARHLAGGWKDEVMLVWLLLVFSFPFLPSVYMLVGGDVETARAAADAAEKATHVVFGDSAGTIMGLVVAAVFGLSRLTK